jgi:hypothetical protein
VVGQRDLLLLLKKVVDKDKPIKIAIEQLQASEQLCRMGLLQELADGSFEPSCELYQQFFRKKFQD